MATNIANGRAAALCPGKNRFDGRREGDHPPNRKQAAADAGMSDHQRKQALRVANVPEDDFERQTESDSPPTVTKRDAVLYSVGANSTHGLPRTNIDKRKAVMTLLEDGEWSQWSNREIARQCAVDEGTVRKYRNELTAEIPQSGDASPRTYTNKHGTTSTMNTENIGKRRPAIVLALAVGAGRATCGEGAPLWAVCHGRFIVFTEPRAAH